MPEVALAACDDRTAKTKHTGQEVSDFAARGKAVLGHERRYRCARGLWDKSTKLGSVVRPVPPVQLAKWCWTSQVRKLLRTAEKRALGMQHCFIAPGNTFYALFPT